MERMNFFPMEARRNRHYLVVAPLSTHEIECIFRGPYVTERNIHLVGGAWASIWDDIIGKYKPEYYDIVTVRAPNLQSLRAALPEFHGWQGAPIHDVPLS